MDQIYTNNNKRERPALKSVVNLVRMRRNIKLNYIFIGIVNFNPVSALWVVYMASKGMSLGQIGIAEALLHVTIFMMEIPTGMVADIFGRRISRIVGAVLWFLSTVAMIFADSFAGFCLAFVLTGLGITMESGAGDALVYDSMKAVGEEDSYRKIAGRIVLVTNLCDAAAILLGGLLSDMRFLYAYLLAAAFEFIAIVISLLFSEPPCESARDSNGSGNMNACTKAWSKLVTSFTGQFSSSYKVLKGSKKVLFVIVLSGILDMSACLCYFYGRELFNEMGWTQGESGFLYMLYFLLGAIIALSIHRLDRKFGEKKIIFAMCSSITLGFGVFAYGSGLLPAIAFLLIGTAYGASYPLFTDYINREIPSDCRATILSLNGAMFSFAMIAFFPLVGMLGDSVGLGSAFRIVFVPSAILLMFLGGLTLKLTHVTDSGTEISKPEGLAE